MPPRLAIAIVTSVVLLALAPPAGAAVFGPPETHALGFGPKGLATGDFNHDGDPDLAMTSAAGVQVLLGGPDGTFGAPRLTPAGTLPNGSPVVADFNGDGDQDLAVLDPTVLHISILLGATGATFAPAVAYDVLDPGQHAVAGDWDSDGDPDLAVATSAGTVRILVNNGAGSLGAPVAVSVPGNNIALVVGEYSDDGDQDIAVVNSVGEASMLLGRAGASFEPRGPFPAGGQPAGAAGGDVTGDGHPDLLIGDNSIGGFNVKLLRGLGPAGFDPLAQFGAGGPSYGLATADFSADGIDDLVITSGTRLSFMAGGGNDLGAAQHSSTTTSDDAGPMAIADVDGDGRRDVIVLHFAAATFSVQRNIAAAGVTPGSPAAAFATQARSTLSAAQTVTLHSTGDSALHPRRVQMAGAHPDDFVVTGDTCSGELLPKGRSCTLKVRFAPSATGPREAQLQLISDAAPLSIALSGVGGALPAGPRGAAGPSGTPRPLLVAAFGNDRASTRAGKRVRMRFVSTLAGVATLELRRGSRVLARASDAVTAGRNALSIKAPRKRGRYTLALTVTGGGQSVTDSARLTVKRRPT